MDARLRHPGDACRTQKKTARCILHTAADGPLLGSYLFTSVRYRAFLFPTRIRLRPASMSRSAMPNGVQNRTSAGYFPPFLRGHVTVQKRSTHGDKALPSLRAENSHQAHDTSRTSEPIRALPSSRAPGAGLRSVWGHTWAWLNRHTTTAPQLQTHNVRPLFDH